MTDELTRGAARRGEPRRNTTLSSRRSSIWSSTSPVTPLASLAFANDVTELPLEQAVDATGTLLLKKLLTVVGFLGATALAVLARA